MSLEFLLAAALWGSRHTTWGTWRGLLRCSYVGTSLVTAAIGTAVLCQKCPISSALAR